MRVRAFVSRAGLWLAAIATPTPAAAVNPQDALPAFAGYTRIGDTTYLAISPQRRAPPVWLREGETIDDVWVAGFDARTDTLSLEVAGVPFALRLKTARIRSEPLSARGAVSKTDALALARQEIERREGWKNARWATRPLPNGGFYFVASSSSQGKSEQRSIQIGAEGRIVRYRMLPTLTHGVPRLLAEPFTKAVKGPQFRGPKM